MWRKSLCLRTYPVSFSVTAFYCKFVTNFNTVNRDFNKLNDISDASTATKGVNDDRTYVIYFLGPCPDIHLQLKLNNNLFLIINDKRPPIISNEYMTS